MSAPGTRSTATPADVADAARIVAGAGLTEAFGHVSARVEGGFLITTTRPMGAATSAEIHRISANGQAAEGAEDVPLETPLHAAVYESRSEVAAICRTHSPAAVRAGATGTVPPLLHGLGILAGEVNVCDRTDLVTDTAAGHEVAAALGSKACVLIRGNGSVAVGESLPEAVVRARYLEERCLVGEGLDAGDEIGAEALALRSRWSEQEMARSWAWLRWKYLGDS